MSLTLVIGETESRWFQVFIAVLEGVVAGAFAVAAALIAVFVDRRKRSTEARR